MKLENYTEIAQNKLIVLYLLDRHGSFMQKNRMVYTLLECGLMNYFTLLETIDELAGDKMIQMRDSISGTQIGITDKGTKTASQFFSSIPKGIRKRINDEMAVIYENEEFESMVSAAATEIDIDVFEAQLIIRERATELLNLKILAGSRDEALRVCKKFKDNHEEAYKHIISYFLK